MEAWAHVFEREEGTVSVALSSNSASATGGWDRGKASEALVSCTKTQAQNYSFLFLFPADSNIARHGRSWFSRKFRYFVLHNSCHGGGREKTGGIIATGCWTRLQDAGLFVHHTVSLPSLVPTH